MKATTGKFTELSKTLGRCVSVADSPCIGVCSTSAMPDDDRCVGCGRTRTEVIDWEKYSDLEKKIINLRNASENFGIRHLQTRSKDEIQERHTGTGT
mgnify:FL=1|jgi:predicted Fe-S protein YdhL (DUF1289 family)